MPSVTSPDFAKFVRIKPNLKKDTPQWPNPEESVGVLLTKLGKNNCWEAVGKVSEVSEQLSKEIKEYLANHCERPTAPVRWSVYMLGREKHSANPLIMFSSKEKKAWKMVKKVIEDSDIMEAPAYVAFKTGGANRQPHCDTDLVSYGLEDPTAHPRAHLNTPIRSAIGTTVRVFGSDSDRAVPSQATVGTLFKRGNNLLVSTVAHILPSTQTTPLFDKTVGEDEDLEFEIDGESDSDRESDVSLDEDCEFHSVRGTNEKRTRTHADSEILSAQPTRLDEEQLHLLVTEDVVKYSSENGTRTGLDFCLLEVDDTDFEPINQIFPPPGFRDGDVLYSEGFGLPGNEERKILCCSRSSGVLLGTISPTSSFTITPEPSAFQEHWKIHVDGCLYPGDCGSVVVDAETADIYGYVVAGSPGSGVAYIVPGYQIFEDLKEKFDPSIQLATRATLSRNDNGFGTFSAKGWHGPGNRSSDAGSTSLVSRDRTFSQPRTTRTGDVIPWLSEGPFWRPKGSLHERDAGIESTNTFSWIFETPSFASWLQRPNGTFWISGKPGAGKTAVMNFLMNALPSRRDPRQMTVVYFFFRDSPRQSVDGLLRSIIFQILQFRCFTAISPTRVSNHPHDMDPQLSYTETLMQDFSSVLMAAASTQDVICFIDALDELDVKSSRVLMERFDRLLEKASSFNARLKFCLSSRYPWKISPDIKPGILLEEHNGGAIGTFVKHGLRDFQDYERDILERTILEQAEGVFLWVSLSLDALKRSRQRGDPFHRTFEYIRKLPASLDHFYARSLASIPEEDRSLALRVFQLLCFARRPVTSREIRHALQLDFPLNSGATLKNPSHHASIFSSGLVEVKGVPWKDGIVKFVHFTAEDFLKDRGLQLLSPSLSASAEGISHSHLLEVCLDYLALPEVRDYPYQSLYDALMYDNRAPDILEHLPFLEYATEYWTEHAVLSEASGIPQRRLIRWSEEPYGDRILSNWYMVSRMIHGPSSVPEWPKTPMKMSSIAASLGLRSVIEALLIDGASLNTSDEEGTTPFHYAVKWGQKTIVELLLEHGSSVEPDQRDVYGSTPLQTACELSDLSIVSLLLNSGKRIDIDSRDIYGNTALSKAAYSGNSALVHFLISKGADVNASTTLKKHKKDRKGVRLEKRSQSTQMSSGEDSEDGADEETRKQSSSNVLDGAARTMGMREAPILFYDSARSDSISHSHCSHCPMG